VCSGQVILISSPGAGDMRGEINIPAATVRHLASASSRLSTSLMSERRCGAVLLGMRRLVSLPYLGENQQ